MLGPASKRQEEMLKSDADITIIGGAAGSGKSYVLNLIPLRYIHDPNFTGVCFRRTTKQLRGQGGIWQTAKNIYNQLPKNMRPTFRETDLTAIFPNGASIAYCHLEHEKNAVDHQGLQYTLELWDELTQFSFYQFEYLQSRLRSDADIPSRTVASCNPDPDSWVREFIDWWLDEDGYPDDSKRGKLRYYVRRDDNFIWASNPEDLKDYLDDDEEPLSVEFIAANIYDNPPCMKKNPGYLSFLKGLNKVEKARLLYGNWNVRPEGANYFKREDLIKAEKVPVNTVCCRAYDKAGTAPSDVNKYPDRTASIKMYRTPDNEFFIAGEFHHTFFDVRQPDVFGRFAYRPGKRDNIILNQAKHDGEHCPIIMPLDPGSAGVTEFQESAKKLAIHGFKVYKDPVPSMRSKLQRFMPFSAAVENGLVHIVEDTFTNKATLEAFYKELEAFDGTRSGKLRKDDWPDAVASAYNYLSNVRNVRIVCRNQTNTETLAKKILEKV